MASPSFIEQYQKQWFEKIDPFLLSRNLNVGSGLGYFSLFAEQKGIDMVSLEVLKHPDVVEVKSFVLYDGKHIPFDDQSFDVSIAMYVLHHTSNRQLLLEEMRRVSSKRIILVEELYHGFFGKLRLVALDFWVNFKLNQRSHIHWNSYFSGDNFYSEVENEDWHITHFEKVPKSGFDEILCVLDKN